MDIADLALAPPATSVAWLVAILAIAFAAWRAPFRRLLEGPGAAVFCATIFVLVVTWTLRASVADGPAFHLLGAPAFMLLAGTPLALVGGALVVVVETLVRGAAWSGAPIAWLTGIVVPALVADGVLRLSRRSLPPNFFVYVFVGCFLAALLGYLAGGVASGWIAVALGPVTAERMGSDFLPALMPLAFGEALLTGMALTLAVVYRPAWVATFDDRRYLRGR